MLVRTVTQQEREEAERREKERNAKRYANSKEGKLENLRLEPIPHLTADEITDLMTDNIGGTIEDISDIRAIHKMVDGKRVAAARMSLFIGIDLADVYDQHTIDTMYDGRTTTEESLTITVYRDPADPKRLRVSY